MTLLPRASVIIATALLSACATVDQKVGQRTVFNNPYATPLIDRTGIGPQCDVSIGRDATCLEAVVVRVDRGRIATLRNGDIVRLTRAQARILRERADILRERAEVIDALRDPPPPPSSEPPALSRAENAAEPN
ncbi:hypothetical protein [Porphyrobacter sp. AAP60]|uniref:hypothetical protein n=1 Tax=Porphyrobacter sp. AAP60 TaxID=1523423 RepID=UPI0006B90C66|nr:hypothetical protein [Porphyrobacter sp. AAP60]KPF64909.1 hypothetical protein IP79_01420 [Porphyrobacter sp. AAP60]